MIACMSAVRTRYSDMLKKLRTHAHTGSSITDLFSQLLMLIDFFEMSIISSEYPQRNLDGYDANQALYTLSYGGSRTYSMQTSFQSKKNPAQTTHK